MTAVVIKSVRDAGFRKYGRIVGNVDVSSLIKALSATPLTGEVVYEPSVKELEETEAAGEIRKVFFGELPVQIGYCNGDNLLLNALEYHRSSELNVMAADAVLILGLEQDVREDGTYPTSLAEAYLVPAGTAVELYATTLHYAPCTAARGGFRVAVVLPRGTNYPLSESHRPADADSGTWEEDAHLTAVNKWLFGHPEGGLPEGSPMGLTGENLCVEAK